MFADAVIVGAGPAGLAAAQRLQSQGLKPLLLEKADQVGSAWRRHYDRLHLHTPRRRSNLPGLSMPRAYGRYPSRAQFVQYLENYVDRFKIRPSFSTPVGEASATIMPVDAPIVCTHGSPTIRALNH